MYTHETKIRVRYAETDKMGFVYYGNYAAYYEVARVEAFRTLNYPYREMEEEGVGMPVLEMSINYHKPGRYDNLLTVKLIVSEMPRTRIRFQYEVKNESNELINTGDTVLAFMSMNTGRSVKMPDRLKNSIAPFFN